MQNFSFGNQWIMWLRFSICYAWRQFYLILVELILEAELDHCFKLVLNLALDFGLSPNYCFLEESAQVELGLWIIGLLSWPVFLLSSKVWLIHSLEIHILELHCCWVVWLCWSLKYWLCYQVTIILKALTVEVDMINSSCICIAPWFLKWCWMC
jgi:hypothetical protein